MFLRNLFAEVPVNGTAKLSAHFSPRPVGGARFKPDLDFDEGDYYLKDSLRQRRPFL